MTPICTDCAPQPKATRRTKAAASRPKARACRSLGAPVRLRPRPDAFGRSTILRERLWERTGGDGGAWRRTGLTTRMLACGVSALTHGVAVELMARMPGVGGAGCGSASLSASSSRWPSPAGCGRRPLGAPEGGMAPEGRLCFIDHHALEELLRERRPAFGPHA